MRPLQAVARLAALALGVTISAVPIDALAQSADPEPLPSAKPEAEPPAVPPPAAPVTPPPVTPPPVTPPPEEPKAVEPPPPVAPAEPPARPRRTRRSRERNQSYESSQPFLGYGLYPAFKTGYVFGGSTFHTPAGRIEADANTFAIEPHMDGVLIFGGLLGVGVSGGYLVALSQGLSGWTFTPFVMFAVTRRTSLKANFGLVEGSTEYDATDGTTPTSTATSALRYGGGLFHQMSENVGLGFEVLHMQSPTKELASYNATGGFFDLAISFSP